MQSLITLFTVKLLQSSNFKAQSRFQNTSEKFRNFRRNYSKHTVHQHSSIAVAHALVCLSLSFGEAATAERVRSRSLSVESQFNKNNIYKFH